MKASNAIEDLIRERNARATTAIVTALRAIEREMLPSSSTELGKYLAQRENRRETRAAIKARFAKGND